MENWIGSSIVPTREEFSRIYSNLQFYGPVQPSIFNWYGQEYANLPIFGHTTNGGQIPHFNKFEFPFPKDDPYQSKFG